MLISSTDQFARNHAGDLQGHNMDRKEIDRSITAEALEMLDNDPLTPERVTNVLFNPARHKGVIGIVASRIMDHYYKPTIMLTESNGVVAGSARSVKAMMCMRPSVHVAISWSSSADICTQPDSP